MLFWRKKCEHEWFELDTKLEHMAYSLHGWIDIEYKNRSYIYCPKCDKRDVMSVNEWKRIEKAQEIKKEFLNK